MRVLEVPVDPATALAGQIRGELPCRQHDLTILAIDPIAINIDLAERVVRSDLLELAEGLAQRAMIPDADVVNCRLILAHLRHVELRFGGVESHIDLIQTVGRSGQHDIVAQKRCLQFELVWLDDQPLKTPRDHLQGSEQNDQIATNSEYGETRRVRHSYPDQYTDESERRTQRDPQADQDDVNVRIPSAKDRPRGARQQAEAVKVVSPGPYGQQQNGIGNKVAQNLWIRREICFGIDSETARPKVCQPKHYRAAQGEQDEARLNEVEER